MSDLPNLIEQPRVEWHRGLPFAFSQLSLEYAHKLEQLAHHHAPKILDLAPIHGPEAAARNPTASRYANYNVFLLDGNYLPLFLAIRHTYRALVKAIDGERQGRFIKCWYNITAPGEGLPRHRHQAVFIGTFSARAEGSVTRFGRSQTTNNDDHLIENRDGRVLVTTGMNHYHEASPGDQARPHRVTYAFDIVNAGQWRADRVQIPFDGDFE